MNAKSMFVLALVVMTIVGFVPEAKASDAREHQLCHVQNMPQGTFIKYVEASLAADPSGNRVVEGCNATPQQFMQGINAVPALKEGGFALTGVNQLPEFLRQLEERPFDQACLSGMNGRDIVLTCKRERSAKPGEIGYWYGDILVLAGDCMNTVSYVAATTLGEVEVTGTRWQPYAAEAAPADHGGAEVGGQRCPADGARMTTVFVYAQEALSTPCAQEFVIDKSRYTAGSGRIGAYESTGNENVFSLQCGKEMRGLVSTGRIRFSTTPRRVQLSVVNGDEALPIFRGTATGNVLVAADANSAVILVEDGSAVDIPDEIQTGFLVWTFPDGGMASPTNSGLGIDVRRLRSSKGCTIPRLIGHAIEGEGSRRLAADTMYSD